MPNISSSDLEKILCNATALDQVLTLPSFSNFTTLDISKALCSNGTEAVVNVIRGLLNIDLLYTLVGYMFD